MSDAIGDLSATSSFIRDALRLYSEGAKEEVLKQNLVSHLPRMFPAVPAWVDHHVRGAESMIGYAAEEQAKRGFIDNLVGNTTIEYEPDLQSAATFAVGHEQVRQHLAGRLNAGVPMAQLVGVLSDTLRWRAYRIESVAPKDSGAPYGPADLTLEEVGRVDITAASDLDAGRVVDFLIRYLGREASRPLTAENIAYDLGFDSRFCARHLAALDSLVAGALTERPDYAEVIQQLWRDFVSYLGDADAPGQFDRDEYVNELYLVTLAKLLCADVIAQTGLYSSEPELATILNGGYFKSRGLPNLVEYDYFGWLNDSPHIDALVPIAAQIQSDLRAYDFDTAAPQDLFGQMLAQLAKRSHRLLLGQEWTPQWLAARMANQLVEQLPSGEHPRFIDMCCGSGSMLVEVVKIAKARLAEAGVADDRAFMELAQVATGFDVDPLAVMLAKVNWVVAARDWLAPFDGSRPVSIPVYLADSLFAKTPLGDVDPSSGVYELSLHEHPVDLPALLLTPDNRALFDSVLDYGYSLAMAAATREPQSELDPRDVAIAFDGACAEAGATLSDIDRPLVGAFFGQLVEALESLQRLGLNGIWAFVLRNSYRPALVIGQFNGLISNPPWLALSKIANNPYSAKLRERAEQYSIKPPGASHLHIELATTFLLHAIDHYLRDDAVIACVLPETVLNGYQHTPFRKGQHRTAARPVIFSVSELWRVKPGTFKNEAVVLFGRKGGATSATSIQGQVASPAELVPLHFQVLSRGDRVIWSDNPEAQEGDWFHDIQLRQGADVMPRTTVFFSATPAGGNRSRIEPIDRALSPLRYLVNEGKRLTEFSVTPTVVPDAYLFDVLLSKHLAPFELSTPAEGLLPIERGAEGTWLPVSTTRLAATPSAKAVFDEILTALGPGVSIGDYFAAIDSDRRKLSAQRFPTSGFLLVQGAGGTYACAAYSPLERFNTQRLIIDQTLYWSVVETEEEAIYVTGLFNSDALDLVIRDFQPQGQFGRRHVHELPPKVTPGFDPNQASHLAVVDTTKRVLADLGAVRSDPALAKLFDPASHLPSRRRTLRTKVLPSFPSFPAYDAACRELYGF